jgi:hypothetical protein
MLPQYAGLEYGLDDRVLHDAVLGDLDAVLGDFDPDQTGSAAVHEQLADYHVEFVCDAVGDAEL